MALEQQVQLSLGHRALPLLHCVLRLRHLWAERGTKGDQPQFSQIGRAGGSPGGGITMVGFSTLFWILCAVLAAYVGVAVIAIAKAYRDDQALRRDERGFLFDP